MPSSESSDWFDGLCRGLRESKSDAALRYEQREPIGRGGMSVVYRAWDRELKRPVALKVLRDDSLMSDVVRRRLEREARVTAGLSHPNIVTLYDVLESDRGFCLVMELVDGAPLSRVLGERKLEMKELLRLLQKVGQGVAAAHAKDIVHRDLKPANILLTAAGEPKVADFGLAHVSGAETLLTRSGEAVGTPAYMAPEQVRGETNRITPRTDVYALGAILYEIASGRPPHTGETVAGIFKKILQDDPLPLRKINPKIPRDLETIVMKALEKEPLRRYASAVELSEDLRRHLDGESILARPPSLPARIVKWARRHRAATAAGSVASIALLVTGIVFTVRAIRDSQRRAKVMRAVEAAQAAGDWQGAARLWTTLENLGDRTAGRRAEEAARRAKEAADRTRAEELAAQAQAKEGEYDSLQTRLQTEVGPSIESEERNLQPWDPVENKRRLFQLRKEHEDGLRRLLSLEAQIVSLYASALQYQSGAAQVVAPLIRFQRRRMEEARTKGDDDRALFLEESIRQLAVQSNLRETLQWLDGGSPTAVDSVPAGADAYVFQYREGPDGRLMPRPFRVSDGTGRSPEREADSDTAYALETSDFNRLGATPTALVDLPVGSYLILLRKSGFQDVRCPVLVERGSPITLKVRLYTSEQVGRGFVYVPGGPFIMEGDPEGMSCTGVRRRETTGDFFIGKFEVGREYRDFLEDLARTDRAEAERRRPRFPSSGRTSYLWRLDSEGKVALVDPRGERWPTLGISWDDAKAFCEWKTQRAKGAGERVSYRLPTNLEWEKAARGVDGRYFPWGNRFDWTFAKGAKSRDGEMHPDPIGAFPTDESPYGVRDMGGSAMEWVADRDSDGNVFFRGASWCTDDPRGFRLATIRKAGHGNVDLTTGFRIVRVLGE